MKVKKIKIEQKKIKGIDLTKVKNINYIDVQPTFIEIEFELN